MITNSFIRTCFSLTFLPLFFCYSASGQSDKVGVGDSLINKDKDVVDLLYEHLKINLRTDSTKLKSNRPLFSIIPIVGYSLQSGVTGALVTNTSFYADNTKNKLSDILASAYYSQYHQYWFMGNTNIFFDKLKLHLFGDTRYYNFPTHTFGLGANTLSTDALSIDFSYLRIYQIAFREIAPNLYAGIGYNLDYHWNIKTDTVSGKALNEFKKLEKGDRSVSSGCSLNVLYDNRKNSENPQNGSYANIQYRPNLMMLGSDKNWQSLIIDLRHYFKLPGNSRNILAFWSYNNFTLTGTPPYLDLPSIGWDDYSNTGRGYVPGRFTGRNLVYLESEYRFAITPNDLLRGVVFCNAESILRNISTSVHSVIPGEGLGLRIKINKYSNTNLAIDYGIGIGGSHGFFFNLGEVF